MREDQVADHIIDIGPEGGYKGGQIIAEGTPEEIAKNKKNWDVVLISIDDINALKKAYPNYYLDSKEFVQSVTGFIKRAVS